MTKPEAILLVIMEPPASLEEEFNDWYDTEHFPQRRALPGFLAGARWVCLEGWPRWAALYDLASLDALSTLEYKAVSAGNSTPWSRRILPRTSGRERLPLVCAHQKHNESFDPARMSALSLSWIDNARPGEILEKLPKKTKEFSGGYRLRLCHAPEASDPLLAVFESASIAEARVITQAVSTWSGGEISRVNYYVRYRR